MDKGKIEENFYCAKSKGKVTRVINGIKMVPERKWVGLTDVEKEDMLKGSKNAYHAIERIEAKLKEKNA